MYITFLWHMHQPYYKDPFRGEYALPWTYLHAVKDYYDMAAIVAESDGAKVVFNLVPSLLEQIVDYAAGTAVDPFLLRGRMAPEDMGEEDRLFVLENFFSANRQRMIEPNSRYLELFTMADDAARAGGSARLRMMSDQDILDLQVWFFLAWTGEAARRRYPEFQELVRKGRQFSRQDKELLFARQHDIVGDIIPLYKRLHDEGKAELSVTPYFHPILPLLCDMKSALAAMPRANLPAARFRHPEDARSQVEHGVAYFRELFGFSPEGMWPSEGSVSDEALAIIAGCGLTWVATDEEVLARTLPGGLGSGKRELYHHYSFRYGARDLKMFFRDHHLSDLIGFTYSQWETSRAIDDFIGRLNQIRTEGGGERVVSIILDGENAWEYYPNNGYDFLHGLYKAVAATEGLVPATFSEVLAAAPEQRVLSHIHPGSWINANYGIWVGHPEENQAWDYIERAREAAIFASPVVADMLAMGPVRGAVAEHQEIAWQVCRSLYAAEGSDWFWWYGDDHFSPHSDRFDSLFRRYVMNIYRLLNLDIPRELFEPIKKKTPAGLIREPAALLTPTINGIVDDYFEWLAAGLYDLTKQSSAMHAAESLLTSFFYGYDRSMLYFRIDGFKSLDECIQPEDLLSLHLTTDREYRLTMTLSGNEGPLLVNNRGEWQADGRGQWRIGRTCEVAVPLAAIAPAPGEKLTAFVTLVRGREELGRWPTDGAMGLAYAGPELDLDNWVI